MAKRQQTLLFRRASLLGQGAPGAHAVLVQGGKVAWVGPDAERPLAKADRIIDCGGATLLPGLHDHHIHLLAYAASLRQVDCGPALATSIASIQRLISQRAAATPPGRWVRARGYDEFYLAEARHPTRADLDIAAPVHPVRLDHRSGHASVLNSMALAQVGIGPGTPDPPEGVIERDEHGDPTGILYEMGAWLAHRMGEERDPQAMRHAVAEASRRLLSWGVTAITDATPDNDPARWEALRTYQSHGVLKQCVTLMPGIHHLQEFLQAGLRYDSPCHCYEGIKGGSCHPERGGQTRPAFPSGRRIEGSPTRFALTRKGRGSVPCLPSPSAFGRAAAAARRLLTSSSKALSLSRRERLDPPLLRLGHAKIVVTLTTGGLHPSESELRGLIGEAHRLGFPVAVHAVEEETILAVLNILRTLKPMTAASASLPDCPNARLPVPQSMPACPTARLPVSGVGQGRALPDRLEHCSEATPAVQTLLKETGAAVCANPSFLFESGARYRATVPPATLPWLYPLRSLRDAGVPLLAGSDAPIASPNPWHGVYAALTRRDASSPLALHPEQCVTLAQALAMYADNRAIGQSGIHAGHNADVVLLDRDVALAQPEELLSARARVMMVGGEFTAP